MKGTYYFMEPLFQTVCVCVYVYLLGYDHHRASVKKIKSHWSSPTKNQPCAVTDKHLFAIQNQKILGFKSGLWRLEIAGPQDPIKHG